MAATGQLRQAAAGGGRQALAVELRLLPPHRHV
jgi:hypothetical protein